MLLNSERIQFGQFPINYPIEKFINPITHFFIFALENQQITYFPL